MDDIIKFVLIGNILGFPLPDKFYKIDDLADYIQNHYKFEENNLKKEFKKMLSKSFKSKYSAQVFLKELVRLLSAFDSLSTEAKKPESTKSQNEKNDEFEGNGAGFCVAPFVWL